jgi:GTP pyrophosphokinase
LKIVARERRADASLSELTAGYAPADVALIERALAWAHGEAEGRTLKSGESALDHAVNATRILSGFNLDAESLAASLLAPFVGSSKAAAAVRESFGARIAELADGVARMAMIEGMSRKAAPAGGEAAQLEGWRKMLLGMAQDVRVVLVKLADQVQSLRYVVKAEAVSAREETARLALDIFAPLANRLGVWQLKWELEDLALRILEPRTYKDIAQSLDEKRASRQRYIDDVMAQLRAELARQGYAAEVSGRAKHIYSIYNKMRRKNVGFEGLYDVHAVRVLVESIKDCYAVLGIVHSLWTPLPKEFDDYIAKPKSNNYQSLHTAVIGPGGRPVEIQIRTFDMHQHAELGVAAHWRYKEGSHRDAGYDEKIAWLRQMVEWKDEVADSGELAAQFKSELFADTIYVLTPQGRVIDLPRDATPIDFAYHVHTELGHRCRGAKIDGVMVPLNTALRNGQQVEILAAKQGGPSRDWLNSALGFLKSAGARGKVRQYFNRQNYEAAAAQGRDIVAKELQRHGMTSVSLETLAAELQFDKVTDLLAAVGRGEVAPRQLQTVLRAQTAPAPAPEVEAPIVRKPRASAGGILVVGVDKLLTVPAKCCKPAPPDTIVGFVSRGRGVTIHRRGCPNVHLLPAERLVEADWGVALDATFAVDIVIEAADRTGLLRDITEILSREHVNVTATNTVSRNAMARMRLTLEVQNIEQLNRMLGLIRDVPDVASAVRG